MRWLARLTLKIAPLLLVAACSHDPIRYIPETDRTMLQAQDRLGTSGDANGGPISVDEMLRRAKAGDATKASSRVVLHFAGDIVQPDAAQQETLRGFAAQVKAGSVVVTSRPGSFDDAGAAVLGPRRAIAVSRELSAMVQDVQVRFEPNLPAGVVVVSLGGPVSHRAEP